MCGRYTLDADGNEIEKLFKTHVRIRVDRLYPRYNISPSQGALVISALAPDGAGEMEWGMKPVWWKFKGRGLINVRNESFTEKRIFDRYLKGPRVLVPATGFYEWDQHSKPKQPWFFHFKDGKPFAFAGIFEKEDGVERFAIATTMANRTVGKVHDRMPVMLRGKAMERWLAPDATKEELVRLLAPLPDKEMEAWKVSTQVNSPAFDGPELLDSVR